MRGGERVPLLGSARVERRIHVHQVESGWRQAIECVLIVTNQHQVVIELEIPVYRLNFHNFPTYRGWRSMARSR